jgi:hypothetical protein
VKLSLNIRMEKAGETGDAWGRMGNVGDDVPKVIYKER